MPKRDSSTPPFTVEYLRSILDYDPETGVFTWKYRTDFPTLASKNSWNTRFAGKTAGSQNCPRGKHAGYTEYTRVTIKNRHYWMHRLAWAHYYGAWPDGEIDHIDGDGLNNSIVNLRIATRADNLANTGISRNNKSGFKGVKWHAGRYEACITKDRKKMYLGRFDTPEEAHEAYLNAAKQHFGDFANGG